MITMIHLKQNNLNNEINKNKINIKNEIKMKLK